MYVDNKHGVLEYAPNGKLQDIDELFVAKNIVEQIPWKCVEFVVFIQIAEVISLP